MSADEPRERFEAALNERFAAKSGPLDDVVRQSHHATADLAQSVYGPELERLRLAYNGANAMMGVHKRRADLLRGRLDHATAALAGDNEGVRLFMADHEQRVERLKEQARLAGIDADNNEAELNRIVTEIEGERDKTRETEGAGRRSEDVINGIVNGLGIALRIARGER